MHSEVDGNRNAVDTDAPGVISMIAAHRLALANRPTPRPSPRDGIALQSNRNRVALDGDGEAFEEADSAEGLDDASVIGAVGLGDAVAAADRPRRARGIGSSLTVLQSFSESGGGRSEEDDRREFGEHDGVYVRARECW